MDQLVQCPVCTLYLHNGMSLESHLDTHPKDQVIKALCSLSTTRSNYGSRSSTPVHSERSYRSRPRTPATEENSGQWGSIQNNLEHDRYWRRTPNRTPTRTPSRCTKPTLSHNDTPSDLRMSDLTVDSLPNNYTYTPTAISSTNNFSMKVDKPSQTYIPSGPVSDFDQHYIYFQDNSEDTEMKYSRSAEYSATNNPTSGVFAYNLSTQPPAVRLQTSLLPTTAKRNDDYVNITNRGDFLIQKPNNIALVKTNIGSLQYITPGVKPVHVMLPAAQAFVPKTPQTSILMTGNITSTQSVQNKTATPVLSNQFSQLTSSTFSPSKTVVTQNSQLIYREMVHNIDGKPYLSGVPTVLNSHDNMGNVTQSGSIYQNVMVVDPYGNTSCVYAPQTVLPQTTMASTFNHSISAAAIKKKDLNITSKEDQKTLLLEITPSLPNQSQASISVVDTSTTNIDNDKVNSTKSKEVSPEEPTDKVEHQSRMKKGLKILSNIKVEVPVQHHKSMLNTIVDLTGNNDIEPISSQNQPATSEKSALELDKNKHQASESVEQSSSNSEHSSNSNTFSVIKNVGNPSVNKETVKSNAENKINDVECTDSCPVPDLICNEKPSISPCSELSENGDNSVEHVSILAKTSKSNEKDNKMLDTVNSEQTTSKANWKPSLKLNNLYVKKHKKVLEIKNHRVTTPSSSKTEAMNTMPSCSRIPETYIPKKEQNPDEDSGISGKELKLNSSIIVDNLDKASSSNNFDADTEEQSMDIEPDAYSSFNPSSNFRMIDISQIKNEVNSNDTSDKHLMPLESIRPINVISYGSLSENFDDDSNQRELLDLEVSSKNKQFVTMINENYFGDNIYADYFTPDRMESFNPNRDSVGFSKDAQEGEERPDGLYIWNDHSQKDTFVLPNFVHESYKIAENASCSTYTMNTDGVLEDVELGGGDGEIDGCEQDSKLDVLSESRSESEVALNICADEKMPPRGELSGQESNGDMDTPWTEVRKDSTLMFNVIYLLQSTAGHRSPQGFPLIHDPQLFNINVPNFLL